MSSYRAWLITKGAWVDLGPPTKTEYTAGVAQPVKMTCTWTWHADRHVQASIMAIEMELMVAFVSLNTGVDVFPGDTLSITKDFDTVI